MTNLGNIVVGDDITASSGSNTFADKNAGNGKTVAVSGITIGGADAGNYNFSIPGSVLADILRKSVTVAVQANNKTYDGNRSATGRVTGIDGVITGDDVSASDGTYTFSDKNAAAAKAVAVSGIILGGPDANNYEITVPSSVAADILRKAASVTVAVSDKTYDGTVSAAGTVTGLEGTVSGDAVTSSGGTYTFADRMPVPTSL